MNLPHPLVLLLLRLRPLRPPPLRYSSRRTPARETRAVFWICSQGVPIQRTPCVNLSCALSSCSPHVQAQLRVRRATAHRRPAYTHTYQRAVQTGTRAAHTPVDISALLNSQRRSGSFFAWYAQPAATSDLTS
ncbi:hypothetical protein HYPSUDRAFT_1055037 [Hypholoma sublateritium FD-334 SS-4]|uniref:Uncharacterized protein n=1 Tax=Hypholoma sublateritium (strain FD-334 SS-4) TaxID=945553 RepID=A0A0D2P907_HYPSF|nr:hypothetical protein HYPSUDRAFT_1055037 [Hypholoma sublateritium FD-334 SS-4]